MERMKQGLGLLFASGWTLDNVLDLTWEQLHVVGDCCIAYKTEQASLVMGAVSQALGGKVKRQPAQRAQQPAQGTPADAAGAGKGTGKGRTVDTAARLAALGLDVFPAG